MSRYSRQLTYYPLPAQAAGPEPACNGARDPLHGYTLAALDDLAARVVRNNLHWWPAGDRGDQHDTAWEGIAEHLCAAKEPPRERDLLEAGRLAVAREVRDQMRHRGARTDSANDGSRFAVYWYQHAGVARSPEDQLTDGLAVTQIMKALTPRQRDAFNALAATGDYALAAEMAGITPDTFTALISRARKAFFALWHEGEEPSRMWRLDKRVFSRAPREGTRPPCGTKKGYWAHQKRGESTEGCGCREAHNAYNRARYAAKAHREGESA